MKQIRIAGRLFKSLLLAGLLAACHNDQTIIPDEMVGVERNDQTAKISSLTRLVKDGNTTLQYVKSGKFFGKISKTDNGSSSNYRYEYTYDDNNPTGDLWISKKQYKKSNGLLVQEWKYKVVNGRCVASERVAWGYSFDYTYNQQGLLDEIKIIINGSVSGNWKYSYNYNAATSSYRLAKIISNSVQLGPKHEYSLTYTSTLDKYSLSLPEVGDIDKYLPIFGKFSDVLIQKCTTKSLEYPNNPWVNDNYTYITDNDGLVTTRTTETTYGNNPPSGSGYVETLKYSDNWQGLPGNP
jgi:hypothetical protein